ncbi:MAG: hypothetical protein E6H00_02020 [Bacillati bacterium ANGP1]|uniref:Uncharacterized protein n=1 Tax=Candidatus Segetimicrobium genomatis TaxID=2569760 RepID=A0A537KAR9_9BACT|nr:MAG: hypothetical protein E6H00_02020 [Terrabacteria group bacterium ANGP1]
MRLLAVMVMLVVLGLPGAAFARPVADSALPACPSLRYLGEASLGLAKAALRDARGDRPKAVALYRARSAGLREQLLGRTSPICQRALEILASRVLWHEDVWADPDWDHDRSVELAEHEAKEAERRGEAMQDTGHILEIAGAVAVVAGRSPVSAVVGGVTGIVGMVMNFVGGKMADAGRQREHELEHEGSQQR